MWLLLVTVAAAQESGEGPLAIPAEPPPPRTEVVVPDRPLAVPGRSSPEKAHAVREYRARHLAIRNLSEAYVGTTWSYGWYGGPYGWGGPGWGWGAWPHPFVVHRDEQAIFQGPNRLDVPATLGVLGDTTGQQQLERRIRRNRGAASALFGLGVAGIAASITGLVGVEQARTYDELTVWNAVSWGGVGLMVGGFVGGSFPSSRAWRLQLEPTETMEPAELDRRIQDYNERLAAALGLDPMEAVRIESEPVR